MDVAERNGGRASSLRKIPQRGYYSNKRGFSSHSYQRDESTKADDEEDEDDGADDDLNYAPVDGLPVDFL